MVRDASPSPTEPANGHVNLVPTLLNETVLRRSTLDDGTLLLIPVQPRRHPSDRAHEKPTLATGWVSEGFFLFQREFAERYLDDSPELLLDQLPLQRVARDGQLGIFGHGGFGTGMDTFRDWTDLNRRWDAGDPWKVWMD